MISAIIRLQQCTTRAGRYAFVARSQPQHGIAAGTIRHYRVTGPTWAAIRRAVALYDTATNHTMGYSKVGPTTVESYRVNEQDRRTTASVFPLARLVPS